MPLSVVTLRTEKHETLSSGPIAEEHWLRSKTSILFGFKDNPVNSPDKGFLFMWLFTDYFNNQNTFQENSSELHKLCTFYLQCSTFRCDAEKSE